MNEEGHVLVIGGGVAGIQAALDLADAGIKVTLVEKKPCIGGRMAQLDKTFPTNDCSICILAPKLREVDRHKNIDLLAYSEIVECYGTAGNFTVKVLKKARYVDEEKCNACGDCAERCPTKVPDEFDENMRMRKAIYLYFNQGVPAVFTIDRDNCIKLVRGKCGICERTCQRGAINFNDQDKEIKLNVDAIILATGFDLYDPSGLQKFGYKRIRNVLTALEFERLMCASGPTGGYLLRPSDGKPATNFGFIQCVGSRDRRANIYCSAVCCMHATKEAIVAVEHNVNVRSYVFYTDIRAGGKGFQRYIKRAQNEANVTYIKGRPARITEDPEGNPVVWYEDTQTLSVKKQKVDVAVLGTSLIPRKDSKELANILGVELDEYGFYDSSPYEPVQSSKEGILLCGFCKGPADIPESVAQGSAAAGKAAEIVEERKRERIQAGIM